jgi:hypothetical protein
MADRALARVVVVMLVTGRSPIRFTLQSLSPAVAAVKRTPRGFETMARAEPVVANRPWRL